MFGGVMVLSFMMNLGFMPDYGRADYFAEAGLYQTLHQSRYSLSFKAEAVFYDTIFLGFSDTTTSIKRDNGNYTFSPVNGKYYINAGVRVNGLEVGFEHLCSHPIMNPIPGKTEDRILDAQFESYNKVYVQYSVSIK